MSQGNLQAMLVLGSSKDEWLSLSALRILEVYRGLQSHIRCRYSKHHNTFKTVSLEQPLGSEKARGTHIPKTGEGVRAPKCLSPAHGSAGGHIFG